MHKNACYTTWSFNKIKWYIININRLPLVSSAVVKMLYGIIEKKSIYLFKCKEVLFCMLNSRFVNTCSEY